MSEDLLREKDNRKPIWLLPDYGGTSMRVGEKLSYNTIGEIGQERNPTVEHSDGPAFLSLNVQWRGGGCSVAKERWLLWCLIADSACVS